MHGSPHHLTNSFGNIFTLVITSLSQLNGMERNGNHAVDGLVVQQQAQFLAKPPSELNTQTRHSVVFELMDDGLERAFLFKVVKRYKM